jgi:hypothetical protein
MEEILHCLNDECVRRSPKQVLLRARHGGTTSLSRLCHAWSLGPIRERFCSRTTRALHRANGPGTTIG